MSALNFINGFFVAPWLFWAGLLCAFAPLVIHLLNRRRYRVVQWAAMDFLREALQRNRRIMQLRDLLLLALRTVVVLLLGMALSQTRCSSSAEKFDGGRPLHAVLLIDNSLSMGYQEQASLGEDLLERAKQRAKDYISTLPAESRVSVIPLCGSRQSPGAGPLTKEDAAEALAKIEVVDGAATARRAVNEAKKACATGPDLDRRIVFFSDQQEENWADFRGGDDLRGLPPIQVVDVSAAEYENTWVSNLKLEDGLADVDTPARFVVELKHRGPASRQNVQVTLSVDGVESGSKTVTLEPGDGSREVSFEHLFSAYQPEPGKPAQAAVTASIGPADRLPADDERHLVVNVVAALPVVFVDQFGAGEEDPIQFRLGETRHLRKLLAPLVSRDEAQRQLVKVRHVKIGDLSRDLLADARLVVVAGIADPADAVTLLREYVEQGGQLILGAGADFSAQRWNDAAWLDGAGILPAPLRSAPLGALPDPATVLKPFFLSFESLESDAYFRLADVTSDDLRELYSEPFFKAVVADLGPEALDKFRRAEMLRIGTALLTAGSATIATTQPDWLLWSSPAVEPLSEGAIDLADLESFLKKAEDGSFIEKLRQDQSPETESDRKVLEELENLAKRSVPRARARFADDAATPFLVERKIGRGQVLFVSSGLFSPWNTLPHSNMFLIFDRIMRQMVETTFPNRNFEPTERIKVPVPLVDRLATVSLRRPGLDETPEALDIGFTGADRQGVEVTWPLARGLYHITAVSSSAEPLPQNSAGDDANGAAATSVADRPLWELPLSVNGQPDESNLASLTREKFTERVGAASLVWVAANEEISLAGTQIKGQNTWWYLVALLLLLLLAELTIVSWPSLRALAAPRGVAT